MIKHYETVFILTPVLSEDQVKEAVKKFKDFVVSKDAKIVAEENWGLKKLQYEIQHKKSGFYFLIEYATENTQAPHELELQFRRDERVLRFLTVAMDKHHLAYSESRREKLSTKK